MGERAGAVEDVGRRMTGATDFWRGRRVLLTGHTGFKGSWLSLGLQHLGAELHGLALEPPTRPALYEVARVAEGMASHIGDIRDLETVRRAHAAARPEVVIHMAAQSLVRPSYRDPIGTYATNVMGTAHVLEAARSVGTVRAIVVVTSDKCYENTGQTAGYREDAAMGGHDPYSNSKGCAELVTSAYRRSFLAEAGIAVASARAGNVIGGGDWAEDRLIPDMLRAFEAGEAVAIRNPRAVRPWQHVLEPLAGYLTLARQLLEADGADFAEGWNFGPRDDDARPVDWIADRMAAAWGAGATWRLDGRAQPHEAAHLTLDGSKARARLGWSPRWSVERALDETVGWHRAWLSGGDMRARCLAQFADHLGASIA